MLKKIAALVLSAVLLMSVSAMCLTVSAAKADSATFTTTSTNAEVGEKVYVTVNLTADSYFTNATIYLHYNTSALKYVADSFAGGFISPKSAWLLAADHADKGFVKAVYVSVNPIKKGGELLLFEFEVVNKVPAEFNLSFDECVGVDENNVQFDLKYQVLGSVSNNDGTVSDPTTSPTMGGETVTVGGSTVTTAPTAPPTTTVAPVLKEEDVYIIEDEQGNKNEIVTENGQIVFDENGKPVTKPYDENAVEQSGKNPQIVEVDEEGKLVLNKDGTLKTKSNTMWILIIVAIVLVVVGAVVLAVCLIVSSKNKSKKTSGK